MKRLLVTIQRKESSKMEISGNAFSTLRGWSILLALMVGSAFLPVRATAGSEEGIALAIVYDTSGSMKESVPAGPGKTAPKYVIANQALNAIVDRVSQYATNTHSSTPRKIEVGLYVFREAGAAEAVKYGPFDPEAIQKWVKGFSKPNGATPLGASIEVASRAVLGSNLSRKHIVVITDGINTSGPKPEAVLPGIRTAAEQKNAGISFHFVAFDVDAKVFDPVKKLGATVLGAANEQQLNTQLEYIFERKILLEDEEPKHPAAAQPK
ncbi:MAG: hypothetical protein JWR69_1147 [Pedosphaera sp.]|nr:hypothetical protein [Pedosphaera sp.]